MFDNLTANHLLHKCRNDLNIYEKNEETLMLTF